MFTYESVENQAQIDLLISSEHETMQCFFYSLLLDPEAIEKMLQEAKVVNGF